MGDAKKENGNISAILRLPALLLVSIDIEPATGYSAIRTCILLDCWQQLSVRRTFLGSSAQ